MRSAPHSDSRTDATLRNFTRAEYDKMIGAGILREDEHVELIAGRIIELSPEGPRHAGAIDLVAEAFRQAFGAGYTVRVQHPLALGPEDEPEPDLAVVQGEPRVHLERHPSDPVLVVEVAESSLASDRQEKARVYARAGIPDYWIVNITDQCLEVHRKPTPDSAYQDIVVLRAGDVVTPLAATAAAIPVTKLLP